MKHSRPDDSEPDDSFTVVMPGVYRSRFERWLRHERLRMTPVSPEYELPAVYLVDSEAPGDGPHR